MAFLPWTIFIALIAMASVSAHTHGNPADELVDLINKNRTAHKSSRLYNNPGLGCMALQYIEAYNGKCDKADSNGKKPPEVDITEVFAPDCGVELPTVGTISGRLLGCQSDYVKPPEAFSKVLIQNTKSLSILYDNNHTEVGAGFSGSDGGGPYFWCVLFGSGEPNFTFALEGGKALKQRRGCFSGTNTHCSAASRSRQVYLFSGLTLLVAMIVASSFVF
eukprot:Gb_02176 [translate_table: standard]